MRFSANTLKFVPRGKRNLIFSQRIVIKTLLIIAIVLSIGVAGCTVSDGNPDDVDSLLTTPVEDDEGSIGSLFEPPAEEDPGVTGQDNGYTDDDKNNDVDTDVELNPLAISGDEDIEVASDKDFDQIYSVRGGNEGDFDWEITGAPDWVEHKLVGSRRIVLEGKAPLLVVDEDFTFTITAIDAMDDSFEASEEITVKVLAANIGTIQATPYKSVCSEPLRIEVVKVGNYTDPDVLDAGEFEYDVDSEVKVVVKAMRGEQAPKGNIAWEFKSEVENSEHCRFRMKNSVLDRFAPGYSALDDLLYNYSWVKDGYCDDTDVAAVESDNLEIRKTTNPFWKTNHYLNLDNSRSNLRTKYPKNSFSLNGRLLYDGPLPVWDMPLDTNPVERLTITASDECDDAEGAKKTITFGITYPSTVGSEGGNMTDMEVHLDYDDVKHYVTRGKGKFEVDCSGIEDKYEPVCEAYSDFAVIFTNNDGLSSHALSEYWNHWDTIPALKESVGWVHYDFDKCDDGHNDGYDNCKEKTLESGETEKSVLDASKVYLLWVAPTKLKKDDRDYADFDIKKITFKNRFWYAKFEDENDDFNNNITKEFSRLDKLWEFGGMTERAHRFSDGSNKKALFHRRELAAYIPQIEE